MIVQPVSIDSGESIGDEISWGAGQDSYYEVNPSPNRKSAKIVVSIEGVPVMAERKDDVLSR